MGHGWLPIGKKTLPLLPLHPLMAEQTTLSLSELFSSPSAVLIPKHPLLLGFVSDCSSLMPYTHGTNGANGGGTAVVSVDDPMVWKRDGLLAIECLKVKLLALKRLHVLFVVSR